MKRLFWLVAIVVLVVIGLLYVTQQDSSYFLLVVGNTSIEMNAWLALALLLAFGFSLWLVIAVIALIFRRTRFIGQHFFVRNKEKVQRKMTQGLIAFIEEDWAVAQKKLTRTAKYLPTPAVNYVIAARCAHEMGENTEAMTLLDQAEQCQGDQMLAVTIMRARLLISVHQFEQALATLLRAQSSYSEHPVILLLLKDVYIALKDWSALKKLLPTLHNKNISSLEERYYLEQRLCQETVKDNIDKNSALDNQQRVVLLESCVNNLPAHFQKDRTILTLLIDTLVELGAYDNAGKVLARNINREWNEAWVHQYGMLHYADSATALLQAETWLKLQPDSAVLYLTLGRLCLQNNQWGRAKDFFNDSLNKQALAETYAELGRLQEYLGEQQDSQQSYRQGITQASSALLPIEFLEKLSAR